MDAVVYTYVINSREIQRNNTLRSYTVAKFIDIHGGILENLLQTVINLLLELRIVGRLGNASLLPIILLLYFEIYSSVSETC